MKRKSLVKLANYKRYSYLEEWEKELNANSDNIDGYQHKRLKDTFEYARSLTCYEDIKRFATFDELISSGYTSDKSMFQREAKSLSSFAKISTGGSSGQPSRIPVTDSVGLNNWSASIYYRKSFGFDLGDKVMLIWGHSHLMSNGSRIINALRRNFLDFINNYSRINAYDTSLSALVRMNRKLIKEKPQIIVGYSSAIYALALYNKYASEENGKLDLKFIVCTSEPLEHEDKEFIQKTFNTQVIMEYGAAETGLIAFNLNINDTYKVNWMNYFVEELRGEIYVTSLIPHAFPLLRYRMNDRVLGVEKYNERVVSFTSIEGREQKVYEIFHRGKLQKISGIALVHAAKDLPNISQIQIKLKDNIIHYFLTSFHPQKDITFAKTFIVNNLQVKHNWFMPRFVNVKYVSNPIKTIAGKVKPYLD